MAPVLFIYLMNSFVETLSEKWMFKKLEYKWFPTSKNGNKRGRLTGQSPKAIGTKFDLFYFLYVNDGTMLFINREDLEAGTTLLFSHFARIGLDMHIGRNAKASKTECIYFPAFEGKYQGASTENVSLKVKWMIYLAIPDVFQPQMKEFFKGYTSSYTIPRR
eukprot:scaffold50097_cov33-Attheya_sp.AAC.5